MKNASVEDWTYAVLQVGFETIWIMIFYLTALAIVGNPWTCLGFLFGTMYGFLNRS